MAHQAEVDMTTSVQFPVNGSHSARRRIR